MNFSSLIKIYSIFMNILVAILTVSLPKYMDYSLSMEMKSKEHIT